MPGRAGFGRRDFFLLKISRPRSRTTRDEKGPAGKSQRGQVEGGNAQEGRR
jgi:hypothetical protein